MAKNTRKRRKPTPFEALDTPTVAQLANGDFDRDFVTHAETNTKVIAYRRRDSTILLRWIEDENKAVAMGALPERDRLFPSYAVQFIGDCLNLWRRCGETRIIANYGERIAGGQHSDGMNQKQALDELGRLRALLGPYQRHYWAVFENVLRHNEPAGVAGSRFANNPAQAQQSAKMITSMVAIQLAEKLGY